MKIETERLVLRRWRPADRAPFAALNADPEVMRHFPACLTKAESDATIGRIEALWAAEGIGFAVAERRSDRAFIGMVGLSRVRFAPTAPLEGAVEIGWRLARAYWGHGYATEAASGWLEHGFGAMDLTEIVAFTVRANLPSQAVMRRLGMQPDPARDFDHPALPEGSPLRRHLVFALGRDAFRQGADSVHIRGDAR